MCTIVPQLRIKFNAPPLRNSRGRGSVPAARMCELRATGMVDILSFDFTFDFSPPSTSTFDFNF